MDVSKSLDCIKKYDKDYSLCHKLLKKKNWSDMSQILNSIIVTECNPKRSKLDLDENHLLLELSSYIDSIVIKETEDWFECLDDDYPDDLFLNDDDDEEI